MSTLQEVQTQVIDEILDFEYQTDLLMLHDQGVNVINQTVLNVL
jgi:hypothetical protein